MLVQPKNFSDVHKLYVSSTADRQTRLASVEVEEMGVYQVTILSVMEGRRIMVEYGEEVTVSDAISIVQGKPGICI